jgi:DNA-binding transcriptional regulator YiaG
MGSSSDDVMVRVADDSPTPDSPTDPLDTVVDWPQAIRQLRAALDCSQAELAVELRQAARNHEGRDAGVNANMVCKWETGEKRPSARYRRLFRRLFEKHNLSIRVGSHQGDPAATPSDAAVGRPIAADRELHNEHPPRKRYAPETIAAIRRALLGYGPEGHLADGSIDPTCMASELERRVQHIWRLRQNARYVQLGEALPPLLADTDLAVWESSDAAPLLVHAL